MLVESLITSMLLQNNQNDIIDKYNLGGCKMPVQALERTFIDKVFAICDYYLGNDILKHSRYIYDLYKILPLVKFDEKFIELIQEVKLIRYTLRHCPSASGDVDINQCLQDIVDKNIYCNDYNAITKILLYENVEYDAAINVLKDIVNTGAFTN